MGRDRGGGEGHGEEVILLYIMRSSGGGAILNHVLSGA